MQPRNIDLRTDEVILGIHHALTLGRAQDELGVQRNQGRGRVGRIHCHAAVRVQNGMLTVAALRRIGVANVAAGAIARPTAAVIPAARVLRNIAAERSLIADLRRCHQLRSLRQQTILLLDDGMIHHLSERGHRADLDAIARRANSPQFLDSTQIDHHLGLPDSILEPVKAVQPSGQHPRVGSMLFEKLLRIGQRNSADTARKRALRLV